MRRRRRVTELGVVGRADAANINFDIALIVGDRNARKLSVDVVDILDAERLQILTADRSGGACIVLEALLTPLDRDNDLIRKLLFVRFNRLLRLRARREKRCMRYCG